ncbi:uncharacterized protein WCC33_003333 [Rhinophrynus dorsalis]
MGTAPAAWILVTALLLWITEPGESKVYYMCGAVLDSMERGLILSPGFPNNYLPGSHCVWQFFVPAGSLLVVETLDFDVFENPSDSEPPDSESISLYGPKRAEEDVSYTKVSLASDPQSTSFLPSATQSGYTSEVDNQIFSSDKKWDWTGKEEKQLLNMQGLTKEQDLFNQRVRTSQKEAVAIAKSVDGLQQESNKSTDLLAPFTARMMEHFEYWQPDREDATFSSMGIDTDFSTTQPLVLDVCPHDVLYISDLVTFSTRFCGSNSPINKTLVFGSPGVMTEVIMELITTTDNGRGFAMLFAYHNQSTVTAMGVQERPGGADVMLLAVIAATVSFSLVLLLILCLSYRQKMCPKREQDPGQATPQVSGNQNKALEDNELQLVVADNGLQLREAANQEQESAEISDQTLQEDHSASITVTDSHSDEVFVISAASNTEHFTFTSFQMQEGRMRRSVTSPASVSDWLSSDYTSVELSVDESVEVDPSRQRTRSVRTFNSLLPPIPQLPMKWCTRTSPGSFTKLVDNGCTILPRNTDSEKHIRTCSAVQMEGSPNRLYSESSASNASYPLTHSAQLQRRLPSCNLKRSRPYLGFLNGSSDCLRSGAVRNTCPQEHQNLCEKTHVESASSSKNTTANGVQVNELPMDLETPKTVFVICEEADDQQPLVLDDQLSPSQDYLSAENAATSIRGTADIHSIESAKGLSDLTSCMQPREGARHLYTETMASQGSFKNISNPCTADIGRKDSAMDVNAPFPQKGLARE